MRIIDELQRIVYVRVYAYVKLFSWPFHSIYNYISLQLHDVRVT